VPVTVSATVKAGDTLRGAVRWEATPSAPVTSIEFWADGQRLATDTTAPYVYELDTTKLSNGTHTLGYGVTDTAGQRTTPQLGTVTVDNPPASTGTIEHAATASFSAYGTSDTKSFTIPNVPNRVLVFAFGGKLGSESISSVTYAGQQLTRLAARGQRTARAELWYLVNPPVGTANLAWAKTGAAQNLTWGVSVYSGVSQTTPFKTAAQNGGELAPAAGAKTVTVASAAGEVVVSAIGLNGGAVTSGPTPAAGQTARWSRNQSTTQGGSSSTPGAVSTTVGWTPAGSGGVDWALVAAPLKPA
jgi:hypothetical protein